MQRRSPGPLPRFYSLSPYAAPAGRSAVLTPSFLRCWPPRLQCGSAHFLQVCWRPPTKNQDQIESYKLMMATTSGLVKDVAHGQLLRCGVQGLRPATEYIFCVKATYADGSFLWSGSKSFTTLAR